MTKPKEISDPIATASFVIARADGNRTPIVVTVGRPYVVDEAESRCPILITGLDGQNADIAGSDSLQALGLALSFIRRRLEHQVEQGSKLLYEGESDDDDVEVDLQALFGSSSPT
jgi:hypothetical protein